MAIIPDVSIERIRSDFSIIFGYHKQTVVVERKNRPEAGGYGFADISPGTSTTSIELSLQGQNNKGFKRAEWGHEDASSRLIAYAEHDTVINQTDVFLIDGKRYVVQEDFADAIKGEDIGFQTLTLLELSPDGEQ